MILDPESIEPRALHQFLIGAVVPRPIAFVSTVGANGRFNAAPFSYFNLVSTRPPLLGVSVGHRGGAPKDTARKAREIGDFVVNLVDEALSAQAVQASGDWPQEVDEFQITGLTPVASTRVRSPRVGESPVSLECVLERVIELEHTDLLIGRIVMAHVRDDVLTEGRIDPIKLRPVGRLGGDGYAVVREVLEIARPRVPRPS